MSADTTLVWNQVTYRFAETWEADAGTPGARYVARSIGDGYWLPFLYAPGVSRTATLADDVLGPTQRDREGAQAAAQHHATHGEWPEG